MMRIHMNDKNYFKIVGISILVLLFGFSFNSVFFLQKINAAAEDSLLDNNRYHIAQISAEIAEHSRQLEDFADSLSRMPEFLLTEELLKQKAKVLQFDSMAVVSPEFGMLSVYGPHGEALVQKLSEDYQTILENDCILYGEEQAVFAVPVIKDGKLAQIVAGAKSRSVLFEVNESDPCKENTVIILKDAETGSTFQLKQDYRVSINEQKLSELMHLAETSREDSVIRQGLFMVSAIPVNGTSWVQIMIRNVDDHIAQMSLHISIYLILLGGSLLLFSFSIRRMKQEMHRKEKIFLTDPLTGGLNRDGFLKTGTHYLETNPRQPYVVVCLNICNFRKINEVWGEEEGNLTLIFVYQMCQQILQKDEVMCRSSIDHFILLLKEDPAKDIQIRIHQLIAQIHSDIHKKYHHESLDFTIGCYQIGGTCDFPSAINCASLATKEAKKKNLCSFYNQALQQELAYEAELEVLFRDSIINHDFKVFLQPKVGLEGSCQAEALVRWIHPEKGMIYPKEFIPLLERSGKISQLDLYMFEETCRLISNWLQNGGTPIMISVNMSRFTLLKFGTEVWKEYKKIKDTYQIPDHLIEIEVTETTLFSGNQLEYVSQIVNNFHSCGLHVSLDDFGVGYSALSLLRVLDIDTIKLDRSFFIDENERSRTLVGAIIHFAHQFGICVVAEGVEEQQQAEILYQIGCDLIQGYVYSPPLSVEDFIKWRDAHEKQKH